MEGGSQLRVIEQLVVGKYISQNSVLVRIAPTQRIHWKVSEAHRSRGEAGDRPPGDEERNEYSLQWVISPGCHHWGGYSSHC